MMGFEKKISLLLGLRILVLCALVSGAWLMPTALAWAQTPPIEDCQDGIDNDGDALIDCDDPDCAGVVCEICDDGIDNDNDNLVDCSDPQCVTFPCCLFEGLCDDGVDNDCDGLVDCDDPDCEPHPLCDRHSVAVTREILVDIQLVDLEADSFSKAVTREILIDIQPYDLETVNYSTAVTREILVDIQPYDLNEVYHSLAVTREILINLPDCSPTTDCNQNGLADECDLLAGTSQDLIDENGDPFPNGIPDECDITSQDFVRGEVNGDGSVNIADAISIFNYLTLGLNPTGVNCPARFDVNSDDQLDVGDVVTLISYLFVAGPSPGIPFPECGQPLPGGLLPCEEAMCIP